MQFADCCTERTDSKEAKAWIPFHFLPCSEKVSCIQEIQSLGSQYVLCFVVKFPSGTGPRYFIGIPYLRAKFREKTCGCSELVCQLGKIQVLHRWQSVGRLYESKRKEYALQRFETAKFGDQIQEEYQVSVDSSEQHTEECRAECTKLERMNTQLLGSRIS